MDSAPIYRLSLFGSPEIASATGEPLTGRVSHRHRLALLALLSLAPNGLSRDLLLAYLWPDRDAGQARNLLKVSVYVLRQELGEGAIVSVGDGLRLATAVIDADVVAFEAALARGDLESAVALHRAPFLDGFHVSDAPEFGRWVERERARLSGAWAGAVEELAESAERRGERLHAVELWKTRAAHDPYDSRVALRLMQAMSASGNSAGAIRHANTHARLLADDLAMEPPGELLSLAAQLRATPESVPTDIVAPNQATPRGVAAVLEGATPPETSLGRPSAASAGSRRGWRRRSLVLSALLSAAGVFIVVAVVARSGSSAAPMRASMADPTASDAVPPGRRTANVKAWDLYSQASRPEVFRSDSASRQALAMFREATMLDSAFAGAHAGMGLLHLRVGPPENPDMPLAERLSLAKMHAEKAIELDSSLVDAYSTLAIAEMSLYRFTEAEAHLRQGLAIDPSDAMAREWLARLYIGTGRSEAALQEAERAFEVDPLLPSSRAELARALLVNDRCDDVMEVIAPLLQLEPPLLRVGPIAAECLAQDGRWDDAVAEVNRGLRNSGARGKAYLGYFLARAGRKEEANAVLRELMEDSYGTGELSFLIAMVYVGLGELDEAFVWLGRSVDDYSLTFEIREPAFASIHSDPRFQLLMDRIAARGR